MSISALSPDLPVQSCIPIQVAQLEVQGSTIINGTTALNGTVSIADNVGVVGNVGILGNLGVVGTLTASTFNPTSINATFIASDTYETANTAITENIDLTQADMLESGIFICNSSTLENPAQIPANILITLPIPDAALSYIPFQFTNTYQETTTTVELQVVGLSPIYQSGNSQTNTLSITAGSANAIKTVTLMCIYLGSVSPDPGYFWTVVSTN